MCEDNKKLKKPSYCSALSLRIFQATIHTHKPQHTHTRTHIDAHTQYPHSSSHLSLTHTHTHSISLPNILIIYVRARFKEEAYHVNVATVHCPKKRSLPNIDKIPIPTQPLRAYLLLGVCNLKSKFSSKISWKTSYPLWYAVSKERDGRFLGINLQRSAHIHTYTCTHTHKEE